MSKQDLTLAAGQMVEFYEPGDFFRLLKADSPVKVEFYRNGAEIAEANSVTTGYAEKMRLGEFDRIRITSTAAQAVSFVTRMGNDVFFDAPPTGAVTVVNPVTEVAVSNVLDFRQDNGTFTQSVVTVTNTVNSQLIVQNGWRRYLLIQNKDTSGVIYLTFNGVAATQSNGISIGPGESIEFSNYCPINAVNAIGSIASNPNIVMIEG